MKKTLLVFSLVLIMISSIAYASDDMNVYLDGYNLKLKNKSFLDGGDAYLPAKEFFEGLGKKVTWDGEKREVSIVDKNNIVVVKNDSRKIRYNGLEVELSYPIKIIKGVTYVPTDMLKLYRYGVFVEGNSISVYTRFDVHDVTQDGLLGKKVLSNEELNRTNKVVADYERRYNKKLEESLFVKDFVVLDFVNYLNEPLTKDGIDKGEFKWDEYLGILVDKNTLGFFSKWKLISPLSDFHLRFNPVVGYIIADEEYLICGYMDYAGSETDVSVALSNYKNSFNRLYGESLSEHGESVVKKEIVNILSRIAKEKEYTIFHVKDGKIIRVN